MLPLSLVIVETVRTFPSCPVDYKRCVSEAIPLVSCSARLQEKEKKKRDCRKNSEASSIQKTEHRVTLTVAFIVTMFTLTNGPSAAIHLFRALYHLGERELYNLTMLCR